MRQIQNNFVLSDDIALTSETISQFRETMNDPKALSRFLHDTDKAAVFLETLSEGGDDWQNCLVETFCKADTVFDLVKAGKIEKVWAMILKLSSPERQIAVLTTPEVVFILAKNGKADAVRKLIRELPTPEQRLTVCTVPYAVFGMAKYGDPEKVLSLIQEFPAPQQADILSVSHVIYGLIDNLDKPGQQTLLTMIRQFSKERQADILASHLAVFGLVTNGQAERVLSWLKALSKQQQARVRGAPYVIPVLSENASPDELEFFIEGAPERRDGRSRKERLSVYRSSNRHLH